LANNKARTICYYCAMVNTNDFKGDFIATPEALKHKLLSTQMLVFDWDGVFNNGTKTATNGTGFSEPDSLGLNLLRFSFWLETGAIIPIAIISGEPNESAKMLAKRECFDAVYFGFKEKANALYHFIGNRTMQPNNAALFFDDVVDLPLAQLAGLRIMVNRPGPQSFINYIKNSNLADYITNNYGGQYALREAAELLLALQGNYERVIEERIRFNGKYKEYWDARKAVQPKIFKEAENGAIEPLQ
jgi:3-deoxy-D-manno-octulosonate 8-phosphate phosphatase (KDO 8-P phosphatase)